MLLMVDAGDWINGSANDGYTPQVFAKDPSSESFDFFLGLPFLNIPLDDDSMEATLLDCWEFSFCNESIPGLLHRHFQGCSGFSFAWWALLQDAKSVEILHEATA